MFVVEAERALRYLLDLVFISSVRAGDVVGKWLGARKFVVGGGRSDNVALASYLPGEPLNGPGDLFSSHRECSSKQGSELQDQLEVHV